MAPRPPPRDPQNVIFLWFCIYSVKIIPFSRFGKGIFLWKYVHLESSSASRLGAARSFPPNDSQRNARTLLQEPFRHPRPLPDGRFFLSSPRTLLEAHFGSQVPPSVWLPSFRPSGCHWPRARPGPSWRFIINPGTLMEAPIGFLLRPCPPPRLFRGDFPS